MAVFVAGAAISACLLQPRAAAVDLATANSIKESGLAAALASAYADARLHVHAAGSERALQMLDDRIVDAAITNAPDAERRALAEHSDWAYQKIAYNQFVVVGPLEDPARVRDASDVSDAFRRIARSPMSFFSRGDGSGISEREAALWETAGVTPPAERLVVTAAGMAKTLKATDERQGYTLCDRGTFSQLQSRFDLVVLFERDARLWDTYAIVYRRDNAGADVLARWLTRGDGRSTISEFATAGAHPFIVWPAPCPGDHPSAIPCP